jgi:hypothetical protein
VFISSSKDRIWTLRQDQKLRSDIHFPKRFNNKKLLQNGTNKKQAFDIPFIGYDYGKDFNWDFDVLFGQYGNPIIGIKIKNIVEQYSADPDNYLHFHTVFNQVVSIIGEGRIVQKLDIFKKRYTAEPSNQFLQQKYSEHFDGRLLKPLKQYYCLRIL